MKEYTSLWLHFSFTRIMYFGFFKYFEVSFSLFRNSLQCNIKTSQLDFYNFTSFY